MVKKKTFLLTLSFLILIAADAALATGQTRSGVAPGRAPTESEKRSDELAGRVDSSLIDANTRFAFDIFEELSSEDRGNNVFISPLSILLALAMTYNGAVGDTNLAMAETLRFSGFDLETLNQGFSDLMASVISADVEVEISIANSIWNRLGFEAKKDFIERNTTYYNSVVRELDFSDPKAVDTINRWIEDATNGKIVKMLTDIPAEVMMYLINAIYFKGDWTHQFSENETRDGEFILETGSKKTVPMMQMQEQFRHTRGANFGLLRLPYGQEKLAMYILLPDEGEDMEKIIGELDEKIWNGVISGLESADVALTMPRYRIEYGVKILNGALSRMGMGIAFNSQADFSGISPDLFISRVMHKAVIEVNEKGSEAAAATVVEMVQSVPERIEFIVNRPFLFMIADDRTGSILFMGKVAEP